MFIQHEIVELLAELVRLESPSRDKAALDALATLLADRLVQLGATVGIVPNALGGNHVLGRYSHNGKLRPALVLCHFDTVWPRGTLERMPFRIDEAGRAFGPGVFDMKASLAIFLAVIEELKKNWGLVPRPIWVLFTSDEEIGSPTSRGLIEQLAVGMCVCVGPRAGPGGRWAQNLPQRCRAIPARGGGEGRACWSGSARRSKCHCGTRPPDFEVADDARHRRGDNDQCRA